MGAAAFALTSPARRGFVVGISQTLSGFAASRWWGSFGLLGIITSYGMVIEQRQ